MVDFGTFVLKSVIMHQVPKGKPGGASTIDYSEAPIVLSTRDRTYIQGKLRKTFGGYARPVIEDLDITSSAPDIVRGLVASPKGLVAGSSTLADSLFQLQKPVSPAGLVMTILGTVDNETCVAIAKMEQQEGMRVEMTQTKEGLRTYKAQYLSDLILGEGTRIFKAGIFAASGAQSGALLTGSVVDDQQRTGGVAEYFVEFLGCKFVQRPDVLTERFLSTSQKYITRVTKDDSEANARYEVALLAELQSNSGRISPDTFASTHLDKQHRDGFINALVEAGVPTKGFKKDVGLVSSRIRRMRIVTARGADVLVPPGMLEDGSVTVVPTDGKSSVVTVNDEVVRMTGAGGRQARDS
jgi:hypothetical protein